MEGLRVDESHPANEKLLKYLNRDPTVELQAYLLRHPDNERIRKALARQDPPKPLSAAPDSAPDPYMGLGSHPDIVERVWDQLGKALPIDCRCIVRGTPALVHPQSGVVLALAIGTQYSLRLSEADIEQAVKLGAKTVIKWSVGRELNIVETFGPDWIFGGWHEDELRWCQAAYKLFSAE